jgi:hypothetical protein
MTVKRAINENIRTAEGKTYIMHSILDMEDKPALKEFPARVYKGYCAIQSSGTGGGKHYKISINTTDGFLGLGYPYTQHKQASAIAFAKWLDKQLEMVLGGIKSQEETIEIFSTHIEKTREAASYYRMGGTAEAYCDLAVKETDEQKEEVKEVSKCASNAG